MPPPPPRDTNAFFRQGCAVGFVASYALLATVLLIYQSSQPLQQQQPLVNTGLSSVRGGGGDLRGLSSTITRSTNLSGENADWDRHNPLAIPQGQAPNLPSIRVQQEEQVDRAIYGGTGDKKHLGGFTEIDVHGISPAVWKHMINKYNIKSLMDVGCGRGISTLWFLTHGVDVLCAEGSHDAFQKSMLPDPATHVVEHDFSRGPWWPAKTYDAVWSVEFLEHVGIQYQFNYMTAFRKAAILFVSSSRYGGWHHTEVHTDPWWIRKYEAFGFRYSEELTKEVRSVASQESKAGNKAPNGKQYNAQHIWLTMKVFINPVVAALPEHAHLFFEPGCFGGRDQKNKDDPIIHKNCGTGKDGDKETPLPESYYPIRLTQDMDTEWEEQVKKHIAVTE